MSIEKELDQAALAALVRELRDEVAELRKENSRLRRRIAELEQDRKPTKRLEEAYSLRAEEQRERDRAAADSGRTKTRKRQNSPRRGRLTTQEKIDAADRIELVLPEGFDVAQCRPLRERPVWRIENGRAVRVVYDIFRGPDGKIPRIDGVLPRSEFGMEISIAVAFLTFIIGLSLDKVCVLLKFFWKLELSKSQADALLNRLSRSWESEFESLCQLLAVSAVVHTDETSWSINSVWAFLSERVHVMVFGCRKDADTLESVVPKATFEGILISDDAAVYRGFSKAQKCWAHLLRKAIRLTLLEPDNTRYREFLDGLLNIYRRAKRFAADRRLRQFQMGESGRLRRIDELTDRICDLCGDRFMDETQPTSETEKDFFNLVHELVRLLGDGELFTFVLHPEASGTNNAAERILRTHRVFVLNIPRTFRRRRTGSAIRSFRHRLRGPAMDRRTGRTSKTPNGARRRTILVSVLESLRLHLEDFTLPSVEFEVMGWRKRGESLFARLLRSSGLAPPKTSTLAQLVPAN